MRDSGERAHPDRDVRFSGSVSSLREGERVGNFVVSEPQEAQTALRTPDYPVGGAGGR